MREWLLRQLSTVFSRHGAASFQSRTILPPDSGGIRLLDATGQVMELRCDLRQQVRIADTSETPIPSQG